MKESDCGVFGARDSGAQRSDVNKPRNRCEQRLKLGELRVDMLFSFMTKP